MKLKYCSDIKENSVSLSHTTGLAYRKLPFFINNCGHYLANSGYFTEREGRNDYLIIFTLSGEGFINYRGQEYTVGPGQVFMINCEEYQLYKTGCTGFWEFKWVHVNGNGCDAYFKLINENSFTVISMVDSTELERYMDEVINSVMKGDILIDTKVSRLTGNILSDILMNKLNPINNKKFEQHTDIIKNVILYIQDNYDRKISIKDFLNVAHISEYHFIRLFKKYTGASPYEYLINYRINKSKYLLKETGFTVNEISESTGFNDVNNFIRDFKKLVGTTPLRYRNFWLS